MLSRSPRDPEKYSWLPPDPPRQPRDPPPSLAVVIIRLMVAVAMWFGTLLLALQFVQWWRGIWA